MPKPSKGENISHFLSRFMGSKEAEESFPKAKQRAAVAYSMFKRKRKK